MNFDEVNGRFDAFYENENKYSKKEKRKIREELRKDAALAIKTARKETSVFN